jgi:hypothetical protein
MRVSVTLVSQPHTDVPVWDTMALGALGVLGALGTLGSLGVLRAPRPVDAIGSLGSSFGIRTAVIGWRDGLPSRTTGTRGSAAGARLSTVSATVGGTLAAPERSTLGDELGLERSNSSRVSSTPEFIDGDCFSYYVIKLHPPE